MFYKPTGLYMYVKCQVSIINPYCECYNFSWHTKDFREEDTVEWKKGYQMEKNGCYYCGVPLCKANFKDLCCLFIPSLK